MAEPEIVVLPDAAALAVEVAARLIDTLAAAQGTSERVGLALTAGSIMAKVWDALPASPSANAVDWSRVDVYWGDERFVAHDASDRNDLPAEQGLFATAPFSSAVRHSMPAADGPDDLDAADDLKWLCYFSTVGVYGDFGGAWIDETAQTRPINKRSQQRVEVEQQWRDYARGRGVPLLVLRLAGIYGPGRSSYDKLREGTARRIVKPGQVFNRIHVADIGRITALAASARLGGTYNLSDGEPAPPQDLVTYAAGLMGVAPPPEMPFETAKMTEMARSFYSDNKRVSSRRVLEALGTELEYPSYREGLDAIWKTHA